MVLKPSINHLQFKEKVCIVILDFQGVCNINAVHTRQFSSNMFGSKIARLQRPFIRQSAVANSINQNLRPKIGNYAYHNTMANQSVQGPMNHSFYFVPDASSY